MRLTVVRKNRYHDSVALLGLARELRARPGVVEAAALMGTPANRELLAHSGLLTAEAEGAGPADLVVVAEAGSPEALDGCRAAVEAFLAAARRPASGSTAHQPRTLAGAHRRAHSANVALISVPGAYAAAEARAALDRGLHVLMFSDNVPVESEVELKRSAGARGLLMMGPDCGTAYLGGVPLGFANEVPRGSVGIVSASGTGLQQVATLLAADDLGPSHAIGVGGRDMSAEVDGLMTFPALDALGRDPGTALLLVIGKPPAPAVRARIEASVRAQPKPAVLAMLGRDVTPRRDGDVITVGTLEDAARAASALARKTAWTPGSLTDLGSDAGERIRAARKRLGAGGRGVLGLFSGGTLAHEAVLILERILGAIGGNLGAGASGAGPGAGLIRGRPGAGGIGHRPSSGAIGGELGEKDASPHRLWDLGADEFTRARAHPMLDPSSRLEAIAQAARDPRTAVLLLDVVLGHGAAVDPAGDLAPAIESARADAERGGRNLAVVAAIVGTDTDPQSLVAQRARLEAAGAWIVPSNAQAARVAAAIVADEATMERLLGASA